MKHFQAAPKGQLRLARSVEKCLYSERYTEDGDKEEKRLGGRFHRKAGD